VKPRRIGSSHNIITQAGGDVWEGEISHFLEGIKPADSIGDRRLVKTFAKLLL
jgi:hypothetical protein